MPESTPPHVPPIWTAPVRYAEVDQQGIVFNAHYLGYCEEAADTLFAQHGIADAVDEVRLVASTLTWHAPLRLGDTVSVRAWCSHRGRTSFTIDFDIRAAGATSAGCEVRTTYVLTDAQGVPVPLTERICAALATTPVRRGRS